MLLRSGKLVPVAEASFLGLLALPHGWHHIRQWDRGVDIPDTSSVACTTLAKNPPGSCKGCKTAGSCTSLSLAPALKEHGALIA